jgi:hypothetical protein
MDPKKTYANPWVLECIRGSDSLIWVNSKHEVNEVLGLWGHRVPLWRGILETEKEKK